uniref:Uncharacterized protein n=1 Tax=Anguilla anguilla TaxID=7936 RepID=A0A0E9V5D7_ANGAN
MGAEVEEEMKQFTEQIFLVSLQFRAWKHVMLFLVVLHCSATKLDLWHAIARLSYSFTYTTVLLPLS